MTSTRALVFTILLLIGVLALFEFTPLDLFVQDHFYDASRHRWVVDKYAPTTRWLFYFGPKYAVIAFGSALGLWALVTGLRRGPKPARHARVLLVVLSVILIPSVIGLGKKYSGVHCPSQVVRYGGTVPYRHLLHRAVDTTGEECGHCFPAGHASAGFAMMSLALLATRRGTAWLGLGAGLLLGWAMGLYQMLNGDHYLSHTLVTMLAAWIVIVLLARVMKVDACGGRRFGLKS